MSLCSHAEHDLVGLLVTGMTFDEIADRLGVQRPDVARRVGALLGALGFDSRAELLFAAALGRI